MYRKSITAKLKERKLARSLAGVEAKRRKRIEQAAQMIDVGGFTTDGILRKHSVRLLAYPDGGRLYAITVDGEHMKPETLRGTVRCLARMVFGRLVKASRRADRG